MTNYFKNVEKFNFDEFYRGNGSLRWQRIQSDAEQRWSAIQEIQAWNADEPGRDLVRIPPVGHVPHGSHRNGRLAGQIHRICPIFEHIDFWRNSTRLGRISSLLDFCHSLASHYSNVFVCHHRNDQTLPNLPHAPRHQNVGWKLRQGSGMQSIKYPWGIGPSMLNFSHLFFASFFARFFSSNQSGLHCNSKNCCVCTIFRVLWTFFWQFLWTIFRGIFDNLFSQFIGVLLTIFWDNFSGHFWQFFPQFLGVFLTIFFYNFSGYFDNFFHNFLGVFLTDFFPQLFRGIFDIFFFLISDSICVLWQDWYTNWK